MLLPKCQSFSAAMLPRCNGQKLIGNIEKSVASRGSVSGKLGGVGPVDNRQSND